ncbi:hypothetical protein D0Y65_052035, partial [Glycine soja]
EINVNSIYFIYTCLGFFRENLWELFVLAPVALTTKYSVFTASKSTLDLPRTLVKTRIKGCAQLLSIVNIHMSEVSIAQGCT